MNQINIVEIKARCADPQRIREALVARGAEYRGVDHQVDTYFKTSRGRLKLREGRIENALVFYKREDQTGPKQSHVSLYPATAPAALKDVLVQALDVLVIVEKQREIYFIENVKFHIDEVDSLGSFVEIEAIDGDGSLGQDTLLAQCQEFLRLFAIPVQDLVAVSYSDLLL
jgi:adenylate cyclase, class 2